MFYFLILFISLFTFLAIKRLELAVQLLIFALPAYLIRFKIGPLPSNLLEVMILTVFVIWLSQNYRQIFENLKRKLNWKLKPENQKLIDYPFKWEIILLIVIAFISAGVAGFSDASLGIWKAYFFEPLLLYIVVMNVFKPSVIPAQAGIQKNAATEEKGSLAGTRDDTFVLAKLFWPLAFSALVVSILAVYQKLTGNLIDNPSWAAEGTRRAVSFFGYPNAVGLYLGPLVMVFIGWLGYATLVCKGPYKLRLAIALTTFLSLVAIIFARSEGALAGVAAAFFVFGVLAGGKIRWATLVLTVVAAGAIFSYQPARQLAVDKMLLRDFSGQVRRQQWHETWQMLAASPARFVFGAGLANYQAAIGPFHQEGIFVRDYRDPDWRRKVVFSDEFKAKVWQPVEIYLYPHNILLNFWSELGIAGMLLLVWIIVKFLYLGLRLIGNWKLEIGNSEQHNSYKFLIIGLISAMIVVVIHGLVDVPYFKNDLSAMFWLFVAMIGLIEIFENNAKIN